MQKITHLWRQLSFKQLLWFTTIASLLLSLAELSSNRPTVPDSITFINAAHAYWQAGWHAALIAYPWPFFPILCVYFSHLASISLISAFHVLNALLQALLCIAFVRLNRLLGASLPIQKIAALVILLYPFLNSVRAYATRESGYWAFALIAVCFLIRFMQRNQLRDAIGFGLSMLIAFLFRVEGLLMLIAAPMALFVLPKHRLSFKTRLFVQANLVLIVIAGAALLYHLTSGALHSTPTTGRASRLQEYALQIQQLLPQLGQKIAADADKMGQAILTPDSQPTQLLLFISGLIGLCLFMIIAVMQPLIFALALYGYVQKRMPNQYGQATLLLWLIIVNLVLLVLYTFEHYFLATRYPAFLTLLALSWVPFALSHLYDNYQNKSLSLTGRPWFFPALLALLIIISAGGIIRFGYSKAYINQAGHWLYQHTPATAKLYTNSREVAFYAADNNEDVERLALQDQQSVTAALANPCQYDWLALRINRNDFALKNDPRVQAFLNTYHAQVTFANKRHDSVAIYAMHDVCH